MENRIIKFRAWEGDGFFTFPLVIGHEVFLDPSRVTCIEQFTGLLDKNGKEIYEGDIVKQTPPNISFHSRPMVITWSDYVLAFLFVEGKLDRTAPHVDTDFIEVVGNIHENPELLK